MTDQQNTLSEMDLLKKKVRELQKLSSLKRNKRLAGKVVTLKKELELLKSEA